MADAFIYDHVRTPRGRGKPDGALHTATTLHLAKTALKAIKDRNDIKAGQIDDVVMGCVDPVGEAGGDIARMGALAAGLGDDVPGVQINRFCASGLDSVNFAAAQVMAGQHELTIGGGVESMSRVGIGASGGAWPVDPAIAIPAYFMPQGVSADLIATKYGFSRDDVDAYAVESQGRAAKAWSEGRFKNSIVPVRDVNGLPLLERDEHMRPETNMQSLAALKPSFVMMGEQGGFDAVAIQAHPEVERINHVHHAGNSSGIVDGAAAVLIGSKEAGAKLGRKPRARVRAFVNIGSEPAIMLTGPVDVTRKLLARAAHADLRHRSVRGQRGVRLGGAALPAGVRPRSGQGQRQRRRDRARPSARRDRRDDPRHGARRTGAPRQADGADHAVHRRRHGHRHRDRAGVRAAMPKIDIGALRVDTRRGYPPPHDERVAGRSKKRLGDAVGVTQFGVNLTTLKPGSASTLRHWHENEDEFVYVLEGELTLIEDEGETILKAGDAAGFKAGVANGHCLVNRSGATQSSSRSARGRRASARIIPTSISSPPRTRPAFASAARTERRSDRDPLPLIRRYRR